MKRLTKTEFEQAKLFIFSDVSREISLAKASQCFMKRMILKMLGITPGGGNFMVALALLSYTEFGGKLKNENYSKKNSKDFDTFFCCLDNNSDNYYRNFLETHPDVYYIFRCGLAHAYYVEKNCCIYIKQGSSHKEGIGFDGSKYYFVIEKYFEDFKKAFLNLENKLFPLCTPMTDITNE